jgi:ribokinase
MVRVMPMPPRVLVVGLASLDVIHLPGRAPLHTIGGAGLYTALAAAAGGAAVTLLAPKPSPMPDALAVVERSLDWTGPQISADDIPRLEIAHHGGGRATLIGASWGGEAGLSVDALVPDLSPFDVVHVAALASAGRMLAFARAFRARGIPVVSAGTYFRVVSMERETVLTLADEADLFFCNENEANGLFGSAEAAHARPGQHVFVTLGERGAWVIGANDRAHVSTQPITELNPTGAGDTFCGAVLAVLAQGGRAVDAAQAGCAAATRLVSNGAR